MDVAGKVAIITGGSSGVGAALAHRLAALGARIVVNYRSSKEDAEQVCAAITASGGAAVAVQGDVSIQSDCARIVQAALDHFGKLDVLVNNAGTTTFVPHHELDLLTEDIWLRTLRVNLMGAFFMSRAAAEHMRVSGGAIVMTSSIAGITANGSSIAYCASKAGLNSLTRTLAKSLAKDGIRVNAVLPGVIDGSWAYETWGGGDDSQYAGFKNMLEDQTPLGHVVTPEDVAEVITSLVTGSDYVTGQLVTIDSGFTL